MSVENLWGELPTTENIHPPIAILREQASVLSDATNRILMGNVNVSKSGSQVNITLSITAPALDNYIFTLLLVEHDILMYPLKVYNLAKVDLANVIRECKDENEFRAALKQILSSEKVHQVIQSLLSQSRMT